MKETYDPYRLIVNARKAFKKGTGDFSAGGWISREVEREAMRDIVLNDILRNRGLS